MIPSIEKMKLNLKVPEFLLLAAVMLAAVAPQMTLVNIF